MTTKWQCLECGELWDCEDKIVFSYCPKCLGGWCKRLGISYLTTKEYQALNEIAGPLPSYDYAQRMVNKATVRDAT